MRCFDRLLAHVLEGKAQLVAHRVAHALGDANAARLGQTLQPRGNVYPVAENVVAVVDDVAKIDADAELDTLGLRHAGVAVGHAALDFDSAAHRVDGASEFHQQSIAGGLDDLAAVLPDLWIDQRPPVRLQLGERALLVRAHKSAIACHVGGQDRCQFALDVPLLHGRGLLSHRL